MPTSSALRSTVASLVLTAALLSGASVAHAATAAPSAGQTLVRTHALASTPKPVIKGKRKVGVRLIASHAAWKPAPLELQYVWKRSGVAISGADHRTYTVRKADRGHRLAVTIIGTNLAGKSIKRTSSSVSIPKPAESKSKSKSKSCDSNYSPCVPIAYDVDCAGGSGNGPAYVQGPVRVTGRDIYGLDYDGDGWGCE